MPGSPRMTTYARTQAVIIGLLAAGFVVGGFQVGRYSVEAASLSKRTAGSRPDAPSLSSRHETLAENDLGPRSIREVATVPFSELYDVLRSSTREQLMAWAADLERMPRGPRQRAAVAAYYKSLIQVDSAAVIDAVLQARNLSVRDIAIDALMRAAPESIWGDIAEMAARLPHPNRGGFSENIMSNWSRVDPVAASRFIETHPVTGEDDRLFSLLRNWGKTDPTAARDWLEADASHQTKEAFRALVGGWADTDHAAAIDYAVANASRPNMEGAINDLASNFFRESPDDAKALILLLPADQAKAGMKAIAQENTAIVIGVFYQRPPDAVARWMVNLPVDLWKESIGVVVEEWLKSDADAATSWLDQMRPDLRDAAVANLCRTASSESTERAIALGLTISDPNLRNKVMGQLARGLRKTRADAIAAVKQLPISPERKSYLLKIMPEAANGH